MTRSIAYLFALCFLLLVMTGAAFAQTDRQRIDKALEELDATVNAARRARYAIEQLARPVEPAPEPEPQPAPEPQPSPASGYPFYWDMTGLLPPKVTLHVLCDESMAAGKHMLADGESFPWSGYSKGGVEIVYEARTDAGEPCVYPFTPWSPNRGPGGNEWPDGSQFIWRSSEPGVQVTFRKEDQWAKMVFRPLGVEDRRFHAEVADIHLDFPGAVNAMGALHIEAVPRGEGLVTVAIRRSHLTGARNAIFAPGGRTMLYVEDSRIGANIGNSVDQEHGTYANGILAFHAVNSTWYGQRARGPYGGHQLKNYAYLTVLENVTLDNRGGVGEASNRPLYDGSSWGFTWVDGLRLIRGKADDPRDALVDLRPGHYHQGRDVRAGEGGGVIELPWPEVGDYRMPAGDCPISAVDDVYLHVFRNVAVESFRSEPYAVRLHGAFDGWDALDADNRAQRAMLWYGEGVSVSERGYRYQGTNPDVYACPLPDDAPALLEDRDAFIRHALGLVE